MDTYDPTAAVDRRPVGMQSCCISLPVRNVEETAGFFTTKLGFCCEGFGFAGEGKVSCQLFRDNASVCLYELRPGLAPRPLRGICVASEPEGIQSLVDLRVELTDVAVYVDEVQSRGVRIEQSRFGSEEQYFVVEDPNGYQLMFWHWMSQ